VAEAILEGKKSRIEKTMLEDKKGGDEAEAAENA